MFTNELLKKDLQYPMLSNDLVCAGKKLFANNNETNRLLLLDNQARCEVRVPFPSASF